MGGAWRGESHSGGREWVVCGVKKQSFIRGPGEATKGAIPAISHDVRFVERNPVMDAIPNTSSYHEHVREEAIGGLAPNPATRLLEGRGQIPVVQANPRRAARRKEPLNEPVIEREPLL